MLGTSCSAEDTEVCSNHEVCDVGLGLCQVTGGPCGTDDDCPGEDGYCDLNTGTCNIGTSCAANGECTYDNTAGGGGTLCDLTLASCRAQTPQCFTDEHCVGGQVCCTDGLGCAFNKCYFSTPSCVWWGESDPPEGFDGAAACGELGMGCNTTTGHCNECQEATGTCGAEFCYVDLGICTDYELQRRIL